MKPVIVDIKAASGIAKATVHKSGRLGFNSRASQLMSLTPDTHFSIAVEEESDPENEIIYLIPCDSSVRQAMKVTKAGNYYSLPLAGLFQQQGKDYKKEKIVFDYDKTVEYEGKTVFVFRQRRSSHKKNEPRVTTNNSGL